MYYADDVVKELRASSQIVVFGAGIVAFNAINCLIRSPYFFNIEYCIVSDLHANPERVMDIPVIDFDMAEKVVKREAAVLIAVIDKNLVIVQDMLHSRGYLHTISIAFHSDLWEQFRGNSYWEYCLLGKKTYLTLEEELKYVTRESDKINIHDKIHVFAVRSHMDQKLQEDVSRFSWEISIQAGAALALMRVCNVCDNTGDNISVKNKEYCELTALYWIWKNDISEYVGLCHYRRHFELDEEMLCKLECSEIDVILTIPILNFPSVRTVYENDHVIEDWDIMLEAIAKLAPDYWESAMIVQDGQYYYGYNMFIMRKVILDRYCEWLFPILNYCEQHCGKKDDIYQNRYIGFLAERLMTIYFIHHQEEYKIVHARKHFVEM